MSLVLAALFAPSAHAFCGTFVSGYEEPPENAASEVAIVRQGTRTTLTVANEISGDFDDFAMVVPVPVILPEDAIHVVDPGVFDRLRAYSDPREVSYTCDDFDYDSTSASGYADTGAVDYDTDDTDSGVDVVAQYVVGEYDVVILSAEESGSLVTWLQTNGYAVPDTSADLLGEYIDSGAYFFAAQVRADAGIEPGDELSPLQFSYESATFGLPIRIGTLNSPGQQDLRIYAFTDYDQGQIAISNYSEEVVDHDCLWQPEDGETMSQYYDRQLDEAFGNVDGAAWVTEYAWGNGSCDPCTGVVPTPDDVYTLGYVDDYHYKQYYYFTRLRMRYTPEAATQDLVLYETRRHDQTQMRFIQYEDYLEDRFPVCNVGMVDNPGSCDEDVPDDDDDDDDGFLGGIFGGDGDGSEGGVCGCASTGGGAGAAVLAGLAMIAVGRRRR